MKLRQKKCKACGEKFSPFNSLQKACGPACALKVGRQELQRKAKQDTRERKQKLKTRQDWLREAQAVFNKYIRLRDVDNPCISCGRLHNGKVNAGHYRTVKAAPHLRFDERQVNLQCEPCNSYLSGNIGEYRIGLIRKIGLDEVEAIESDNRVKRWTIEEAKAIKEKYTKKIKELQNV